MEQANGPEGQAITDDAEDAAFLLADDDGAHGVEYAPNGDVVLSPSQHSTFVECNRLWGLKYLGQHPERAKKGTLIGKRMHRQLELYYKKGRVPDQDTQEGICATALLKHLPLPGPERLPERKFRFEWDGVFWRGSKDLTDIEYLGDPEVTDFKSTSDLKWAKTPEMLLTDVQAVTYALEEMLRSNLTRVRMKWAYVTREAEPRKKMVPFVATIESVKAALPAIYVDARRMLQLYRERPDPNTLDAGGIHNGRCEKYGGCPYANTHCEISDRERLMAHLNQEARRADPMGNDLLAAMAAAKNKKAPAGVTVTAILAPAVAGSDVNTTLREGAQVVTQAKPATARELLAGTASAALNPEPFTPPPEQTKVVNQPPTQEEAPKAVQARTAPTPPRGSARKTTAKPAVTAQESAPAVQSSAKPCTVEDAERIITEELSKIKLITIEGEIEAGETLLGPDAAVAQKLIEEAVVAAGTTAVEKRVHTIADLKMAGVESRVQDVVPVTSQFSVKRGTARDIAPDADIAVQPMRIAVDPEEKDEIFRLVVRGFEIVVRPAR